MSAARARALSANPVVPLLSAQKAIDALLAKEDTFRDVVTMGLPTGRLQMPPMLEPGVVLNLELGAKDPAELRAASQEYAAAASKADELLTYAEAAQLQGDQASIRQNLDGAFAAVARCKLSLQRMLAALPAGG